MPFVFLATYDSCTLLTNLLWYSNVREFTRNLLKHRKKCLRSIGDFWLFSSLLSIYWLFNIFHIFIRNLNKPESAFFLIFLIALFKRPLAKTTTLEGSDTIFECQTEEQNSAVEWFKDGNELTDLRYKRLTLPDNIHKLTIQHTSIRDGGKYSIEKNGFYCEAVLSVKGKTKVIISS